MNGLVIGLLIVAAFALVVGPVAMAGPVVDESARDIPVAYDVDVVVVGGSTAGVSAAVAAAQAGAKVFLAAPRPYLGEDLCATKRLWLEAGETPRTALGAALFADEGAAPSAKDARALAFTYTADLPPAARHPDRKPPRLTDGIAGPPETHSVQYDGDVTITCDLGQPVEVAEARAVVFHRAGDFSLGAMTVETSLDGKAWKDAGTAKGDGAGGSAVTPAVPVGERIRYARVHLTRAPETLRVLLGEVLLIRAGDAPAAEPEPARRGPVRPLHVKKTLDEALLAAGVEFLFGCYATDVLTDSAGRPAGIVMANRSGRQAVLAKTIIDATDRAWVARMAGAEFRPYPKGERTFRRVVIGGDVKPGQGIDGRKVGLAFTSNGREYAIIEYALALPMADGSFASLAEAEQKARDLTWDPGQTDASEVLFDVPPDPMKGRASLSGAWPGAAKADLGAFRPAGVDRLYVVGGCADVPRDVAEALLRPTALMPVAERIGRAAADEAKGVGRLAGVRLAGRKAAPKTAGDVRELLAGVRPTQPARGAVPSEARSLPVIGEYDVVVIGGGTGGAPAGIAAGRHKARTLVVEYLHGLGGVGTLGMITKYYHGYRGGFTAQVDKGIQELGAAVHAVGKAEWWRRANREAGTDLWLGCLGCGAFVEDGLVKGAVVATPAGRGVVLAKTVIDSTGNADIAAAAGAQTMVTGGEHVGIQGAGLPPIGLGADYTNTDYMFADDTDVVDFWHLFVYARGKFKDAYDLGQLVDTRERQRIVGDVVITPMDMMLGRTWPDVISMHKSNFDSHGFTVHPIFLLRPPDREDITVYVPMRALMPKGLDGILVTGLGASAHRDAIPVIRMQPCVQNQGYAAGTAGAMAARTAATVRGIDLRSLQEHLVAVGCLPKEALAFKDSLPLPKARVAEAVRNVGQGHEALAVILAQPETSVPMLREAYADAEGEARLAYAHVLGMMWDATGAEALLEKVRSAKAFDKGWNYRGMGQFGMSLSELDSYLIALGRTRDPRAVGPILEKAALLDASKEFSHHRAVAMALEALAGPPAKVPAEDLRRAAKALADLLARPGMTGYATTTVEEARRVAAVGGREATQPRNDSLRELVLARALYRLGDCDGLGRKTLERYAADLRGHYARHARAVLDGEGTKGRRD